jgi:hypothetical protein
MVATRCIATGQDTYMCDTLIPCYEPKSGKQRAQSGGRKDRKPYSGKISWFILPVIQGYDKDSLWYPYIEEMSNGQNLKILSTADLIALNSQSPVGGVTKHPNGGISIGANVGLIQTKAPKGPKNHNPIYFDKHKVLFGAIAIKKFTDEDGNSLFSEIIRNYNINQLDEFESLEDLFIEDIKIKRTRSYIERNYSDIVELDKLYCYKFPNDYGKLPNNVNKLLKIAQSDKNTNREKDLVYQLKLAYIMESQNISYDYVKNIVKQTRNNYA